MKLLILAFSLVRSIWWVPNSRPSCLLGRPLLSKSKSRSLCSLSSCPLGEQGGPGWRAGKRRPPVAMALSPPISACIEPHQAKVSGCVKGAGGMAQWGGRRGWQLETWKPEPPDLATSPDLPSS